MARSRGDYEGVVDQLVRVRAAFVPRSDEIGFRFAALVVQLLDVITHLFESFDLL